jgi:hypothetical protein
LNESLYATAFVVATVTTAIIAAATTITIAVA